MRRFTTIVEDEAGNFLHLLCLAEAAVPVRDRAKKIKASRAILNEARAVLQAQIKQEAIEVRGAAERNPHPAN